MKIGFIGWDVETIGYEVAYVPGAVEIPLIAKTYLDLNFDGVVAIGAVIRGETTHYESVCNSVERGCTLLQIEYGKPVTFGVITTENDEQAEDRAGGKHGNKGRIVAETCIKMINLIKNIQIKNVNNNKGQINV